MTRIAQDIPKIGLVMENARVVRWLKDVGDRVRQGEPLLELETEKSVVEIEATVSGRLVEKLLRENEEAHVGDRVAWVESDVAVDEEQVRAPVSPSTSAPTQLASDRPGPGPAGASVSAEAATPAGASAPVLGSPHARVRSSPVARRMAAQSGIDLAAIVGTGPRGRVQLSDVRRAIHAAKGLSNMRRAVARAMMLSNATVPQFIVARAVDWTAVNAVRAKLLASGPEGAPKPSVNDFLLQAVARALLSFPALNATFSGDPASPDARIVPAVGAHIGLVVAVNDGLRVPVIHNVEKLGLRDLARRRMDCVRRAVEGRLKREDLEGATFSISNLGSRGPDRFTALINPPESAILAVGRQRDCVVARDGGMHVRPMSDLSLTVDHRVADGRLAADFLAGLVQALEGAEWRLE